MREPPPHVPAADVLAAVQAGWLSEVDAVEHLPVGFGAHHWAASAGPNRRLFVTLDGLLPRHTARSLEGAYAAAATLAAGGLEFVVAPLPSASGPHTMPLADGMLSVTGWLDGRVAGDGLLTDPPSARANVWMLARLHAADPPDGIPIWAPLVQPDFADSLVARLGRPWGAGPYAARARDALRDRHDAITSWVAVYHRLADEAHDRAWVPTHGEPHTANQLVTPEGTVLVDWESLKLAPRERDLRALTDAGHSRLVDPDWPMIEMFDLEWRLDEISQYATWFEAPHTGTASDAVAFGGLIEELARPEWRP